jgi:CRISPR system Cascade subunit CasE
MFLSLLTLNACNAQVHSEMTDLYQLHKTLLSAFADGGVHQDRRNPESHALLYRAEKHPLLPAWNVLVQSCSYPNWTSFHEWRDNHRQPYLLQPTQCKPFELHLINGQHLAFRLRANPTRKKTFIKGDPASKKRIAIWETDALLDWIQRKFDDATSEGGKSCPSGFRLLSAQVSREAHIKMNLKQPEQSHQFKCYTVQFDGMLEVVQPNYAVQTVHAGIGSGKAFGFGLLSLALA